MSPDSDTPPLRPDPADVAGPARLSPRTTPTWEMEILVSGATVFALLQLAQSLPGWAHYLLPRLSENWSTFGQLLFTYAQSAVLLLAITFVVHLGLRAYWVALAGLDSVFPGGPKPAPGGRRPLSRRLMHERWGDVAGAIERADNRATVVFGVGIGLVVIVVAITLTVCGLYALAAAIAAIAGRPDRISDVFLGLMVLWFVPFAFASAVDRWFGPKLRPDSVPYRLAYASLRFSARLGLSRDGNALISLYSSHVGQMRAQWSIALVMLVGMAMALATLYSSRQELGPGGVGLFPEPAAGTGNSVEGRHYAALMEAGATPAVPYLPGLVSKDDWLRVVVPFMPRQQGHLLSGCAGANRDALHGDGDADGEAARREHARICMRDGIVLRVDGEPQAIEPVWFTEPSRDLRAMLYMLPAAGLAPGRHEVSVQIAAPADSDRPPTTYRIPFWR